MHSIAELKLRVDEEIKKLEFNTAPGDLYNPITYMLALDAKRLRPVLVLCGCEMFGGDPVSAIRPALGIEVFHNFTLLHDDIMDNAPLRRNHQTIHAKWNVNVAILSGDAMFVKACQLVMQVPDPLIRPVMDLFYKTALEVCEGQQIDMDFEKSENVSIPDYLDMISRKTAVLLGASLETGAIIAGASSRDAEHIYEFGRHIGLAFQLKDDILDVFGDDKKFGKRRGGDIVSNKKTFLLLKAFELADEKHAADLRHWLQTPILNPEEKVNAVTTIYNELHIRNHAESEMELHMETALFHLDAIDVPVSRKEVLRDFAGRLMVREA